MPNYTLPAIGDISVTNVCNAACGFCGFARDKTLAGPARSLAAGQIGAAGASLFRRSVAQSVLALMEETPKMRRLALRRKQVAAAGHPAPAI
jgi:hypothetical protein